MGANCCAQDKDLRHALRGGRLASPHRGYCCPRQDEPYDADPLATKWAGSPDVREDQLAGNDAGKQLQAITSLQRELVTVGCVALKMKMAPIFKHQQQHFK